MRAAAFLLVLLFVSGAQAFGNPVRPFETTTEYTDSLDALDAVVSAEVTLDAPGAQNGSLFLGADEFTFAGMTRLYWEDNNGDLQFREGTNLQVRVENRSSVAFRHPGSYDVRFHADHALTLFADAGNMFGEENSEEIGFGPAMVAIPVNGQAVLPDLGHLPETPLTFETNFNDFIDDSAALLTFTSASILTLIDSNGFTIEELVGSGRWVGFQGTPTVGPIAATMVALPTPIGANASFVPAASDAAAEGISAAHIENAISVLSAAEGDAQGAQLEGLEEATDGLAPVLNGAFLGVTGINGTGPADVLGGLTMVRFTSMEAERTEDGLAWTGRGALQIQNGEVAGADPLIGIFPWWSLLLWGLAIVGFVLRVVLKPEKSHPLWDKFGWVGWVGGILAGILVFILWDRETKALWGTSILSGEATGAAFGVIALVQILPLMFAGLAIGLPSRILIKSGTRFAGQGNMMRIGQIVAPFLVFLLGVPLMIDYLGALMEAAEGFA